MPVPPGLAVLVLSLAAAPTPDGDTPSLEQAARSVVERLAAGAFAEVAPPARPGAPPYNLTAEALERDWDHQLARFGPFGGIDGVRLEPRPTGDYAYVRCRFGDRPFDARMLLGHDRKPTALAFLPAPLGGPGLLRAQGYFQARPQAPGSVGTIAFPVPGTYRDQVPLTFAVRTQPADALRGYRWRLREDGLNWLCEVEVAPPEGGVFVRWEALVLVGDRPTADLPPAPVPECPVEAKPWTRSTACVQADDPAIQARAAALAEGLDDVGAFARRAVEFAATNPLRMGAMATLDARCALDTGSSCTGRANLAAALLRARGIPARTVAHLPTWSGPLFEHWLVEYWHPGAGWVWAEPSLGRMQPEPWTVALLSVSSPDDEDAARSFAPYRVRGVMAGAPSFSVPELSGGLQPDSSPLPTGETSSLATPEVRLDAPADQLVPLFDSARRRFETHLTRRAASEQDTPGRVQSLIDSARTGGSAALLHTLAAPAQ